MANRKLKVLPRTQFGNPILRTKAKNVPLKFLKTAKFKKLIKEMTHTMRRAHGVGLAAPQIGESLKLAVMEIKPISTKSNSKRKGHIVIINPKITKYSQDKVTSWEGCLSFKGVRGSVQRSKSITVEYINEKGEKIIEKATGLWAKIFQHEIDHLNGIVYIDQMKDMKKLITFQEFKKRILKT